MKKEKGITLVALIITIILLIILAAVTISAVYKSRIVEFATNGALGYLTEQEKELGYLNKTEDKLKEIEELLKKDLGSAEGKIAFSSLTWSNQKASVTIRKVVAENYTIKYRVVDKNGTETVTEREIASGGGVGNLNLGDMVIARLTDGINNGNTASITVTDLNSPTAPTFGTATGTVGTNSWYKTAVTVPITPGTDAESGVLKTTYTITGAGAKGETEGTSVSISAEGTSVVTAYTYDKAGNKKASVAKTIKIDTSNPNIATTTYVAHDTTSITVRTTAQDTVSGLAKVEYQYSTDGTSYTTKSTSTYTGTTAVTTNNGYKYTGLKDGTKYWLRIRVTDMAGRVTDGAAIAQTTVKAGISTDKLNIGDYIAYQPDTPANATYSTFQDGAERSGSSTQTLSRDTTLKWRILKPEGNALILVSETATSGKLKLNGADGYNNGVRLLNDSCNELYRNATLGGNARSLNVDDINELLEISDLDLKKLNEGYYGNTYLTTGLFPTIFQYEQRFSRDGNTWGRVGQSEATKEWYQGTTSAGNIYAKTNYYNYWLRNFKDENSLEVQLIYGCPGQTRPGDNINVWLSTRMTRISPQGNRAYGLFSLYGPRVWSYELFNSVSGTNVERDYLLRVVVIIDLKNVAIGITGTGEQTNPYSITAR